VAAINKFNGRKLRSATLTRIEGARVNPATEQLEPGDDIDQMDRAFRARQMANNVRKLAEFMAGVRGRRKSMLLIGEGVDYDIYEAVGSSGSTASSCCSIRTMRLRRPLAANVTIYTIDPRGLMNAEGDLIEVAGTVGDAGSQSIANEMRLSQDSLRVLADSTGGFAAVNRNESQRRLRLASSGRTAVTTCLGFYSTNDRRNGRYRKLEVRVKRPGPSRAQPQWLLRGPRASTVAANGVELCDSPGAGGLRRARQPTADGWRADQSLRGTVQRPGTQCCHCVGVRDRREGPGLRSEWRDV
jgi:hypothetical protein